ncbi:hypothetical protein EBB79_24190 (plasmid) [Parasedimentitalea marina]|uniref:Uncharacterized protein n=1 Tax=Parasedimentitalea marina TaxID=2483033 RepID=A0A3T0NAK0_9RHOB|nr:hypothetical protein EBB79_24190 [Parasedimentitalea marina]
MAEVEDTSSDDALESLAAVEIAETPEDDGADILGDLAAQDVAEEEDTGADELADLLGGGERQRNARRGSVGRCAGQLGGS